MFFLRVGWGLFDNSFLLCMSWQRPGTEAEDRREQSAGACHTFATVGHWTNKAKQPQSDRGRQRDYITNIDDDGDEHDTFDDSTNIWIPFASIPHNLFYDVSLCANLTSPFLPRIGPVSASHPSSTTAEVSLALCYSHSLNVVADSFL